jgi:hypothetical protein
LVFGPCSTRFITLVRPQDVMCCNAPSKPGNLIGIFEVPERSVATMIPLLFTPLYVAVATPFIRQWRRWQWTYALRLVPLTCWWDGLLSNFARTRSRN